jgi:hypothetical protein
LRTRDQLIDFPQSQKRRLRQIAPGLTSSARDVEIKMITTAEYRAWAEESLEWAQNATNESSRQAFIRWAEVWLEIGVAGRASGRFT